MVFWKSWWRKEGNSPRPLSASTRARLNTRLGTYYSRSLTWRGSTALILSRHSEKRMRDFDDVSPTLSKRLLIRQVNCVLLHSNKWRNSGRKQRQRRRPHQITPCRQAFPPLSRA